MISLCIPTYNRSDFVLESFSKIVNNEVISEIVIVDDCSDIKIYEDLKNKISLLNSKKIKIMRNKNNLGAFLNKLECVKNSGNDWAIILDSDNIIDQNYLQNIFFPLDENLFYLPSIALCKSPNLNYSKYANKIIDKELYKNLLIENSPNFRCLLNTGNYLCNKKTYINSIIHEKELINPYASDVFYQIYLCFKNIPNFKLKIVKNMTYYHRLHNKKTQQMGSFYIQNSEKSYVVLDKLRNLIKNTW